MYSLTTLSRALIVMILMALPSLGAEPKQPAGMDAWAGKIEKLAPTTPTRKTDAERKLLMFSLATGYQHSVIPYVDRAIDIVGKRSGAYRTTITRDISDFAPAKLGQYDILALNNTCSKGARRDLLLDVLESDSRYKDLSAEERSTRARSLEQSILNFVRSGKGLVVIHGAPTLLNNSAEFTQMVGGAFDYHPPAQEVTVRVVEPDHPLLQAFHGQSSFVHRDEPYCFKGAYGVKVFRPLLQFDSQGIKDPKGKFSGEPRYSAWIKPYGKGRVFYCSPSHFPESYENTALLRFLLDGIQYAAGDIECPDTPTVQ